MRGGQVAPVVLLLDLVEERRDLRGGLLVALARRDQRRDDRRPLLADAGDRRFCFRRA